MSQNRFEYHSPSTPYNQKEESLHLEPILRLIATLIQDHCSPWKNCNLFVPKIDSSANRIAEMQTLVSDTHIFRVGIKTQVFETKSNWNFHTHVHIYT